MHSPVQWVCSDAYIALAGPIGIKCGVATWLWWTGNAGRPDGYVGRQARDARMVMLDDRRGMPDINRLMPEWCQSIRALGEVPVGAHFHLPNINRSTPGWLTRQHLNDFLQVSRQMGGAIHPR